MNLKRNTNAEPTVLSPLSLAGDEPKRARARGLGCVAELESLPSVRQSWVQWRGMDRRA